MPGTSIVLARPGTFGVGTRKQRLGDDPASSTTEILRLLFSQNDEAGRRSERRADIREARELALEDRARRDAKERQDKILEATQKSLEQAAAAQQNLIVASSISLKTTLNRVFILGGITVAGILIASGRKSKKAGARRRRSARKKTARASRTSFRSPSLWRAS